MKSINQWCQEIKEWRISKGFHTPESMATREEKDLLLGKLMLIVTELSEAAEAVRKEDYSNFVEEIADATIRIFELTGTMGFFLEQAIEAKMEKNRKRPHLHGKLTSL